MSSEVLDAVRLTLLIASTATAIVFVPGALLAYALARFEFPGKGAVSALVGLPLVLPPTAVGYLLLGALGFDGPLGGLEILLTWKAAVVASSVMAAPLMVRTAQVAFEGVDPRLEQVARTLGRGPWRTFLTCTLPLAARGLLAAAILSFTRAVGEFGATVTIAGNIPGRTQTLASAIFSAQQVGDHDSARALLAIAVGLGLSAILASEWLVRSGPGRRGGR